MNEKSYVYTLYIIWRADKSEEKRDMCPKYNYLVDIETTS
jgi:hypothetical protein